MIAASTTIRLYIIVVYSITAELTDGEVVPENTFPREPFCKT
jgi:hypothetical protein